MIPIDFDWFTHHGPSSDMHQWLKDNVKYPVSPYVCEQSPHEERTRLVFRYEFQNMTDALLFKLTFA